MKKVKMDMMRVKLMREILNAKVRFLAITLVVVIGVIIFIAASMSYHNLKTSYEYTYEKLNFADFRVKSEEIPPYIIRKAGEVKGVELVTPRVRRDEPFVLPDGRKLVGRVTGIPTERPLVDDLLMKEGRFFEKGDRRVCIAESHFASFYDLHPGDVLVYNQRGAEIPVKIIGVAGSPEYLVMAGEKGDFSPMLSATAMAIIWMPVDEVQLMAQMPGKYNQALFKVEDPRHMDPVMSSVEEIMKNTGIKEVITREEHQGNRMMQMDLEGFRSFALFFPLLFLGIACFSIYILLSRLVHIQRPFIGVMRAMGYTKKQILSHYLSFALIIGILGAVIGAVAGYGLSYVITGVYAGTMGIPLVKIRVYWSVIFQGMTLSILFCALAGMMPALKSAKLDPAKAMRGEMLQQVFKKPVIERLFPPISGLPLFLKFPLRNMSRNRRRTAFTLLGLVFSVMLVMVFLATLDTASDAMNRGFNLGNRFDMVAIFLGGSDAATIDRIERIEGVEAAEPTVGYNCKVSWDGYTTETVMMGLLPDTRMKRFYNPQNQELKITNRHVLMSTWYHDKKGLEVGDRIRVATTQREKGFIVGGFVEEPMGSLIYMPREEARELLAYGLTSRGGFYVKANPGMHGSVRRELQKVAGLATIIDLEEIKREVGEYMKLMYIIVYVMLAFALVMAFTLTFNTITINVLEREREIATLRTIGTQSWKISAMTTLENVIFGLISLVPGFILGIAVGRYALSLQNSDLFTLSLSVHTRTYWVVAAGIMVVLLLCQVPGLRYVKRVHLAEATKERTG